jgi:hypothetical protein
MYLVIVLLVLGSVDARRLNDARNDFRNDVGTGDFIPNNTSGTVRIPETREATYEGAMLTVTTGFAHRFNFLNVGACMVNMGSSGFVFGLPGVLPRLPVKVRLIAPKEDFDKTRDKACELFRTGGKLGYWTGSIIGVIKVDIDLGSYAIVRILSWDTAGLVGWSSGTAKFVPCGECPFH